MSSRRIYSESVRKLVLAFDVGTTYSGISYSILDPGKAPSIKGVTKFPGQEHVMGASKIPTVIYYDSSGNVRAVGAEAAREGIEEEAEDGNWVKVEWFKLHFRSKDGGGRDITRHIPSLPPNKKIAKVWADFLHYLFACARNYIEETEPNGPSLWNSLKDRIHFVLSHPNGWEGKEQRQMRKAIALAKLIPDTRVGHAQVSFITEGEASLHFAIENGVLSEAVKVEGIVIVDAGGGTVDISTYKRDDSQVNRSFDEIAAPQCHLHGSVFVSIHARVYLEDFLSDSPFIDDLDHIVHRFDDTTKIRFRNADDLQYIRFGSARDNDETCGIRFGQLKLSGAKVAEFFQPSTQCIIKSLLSLKRENRLNISHVVLVGGFSASDYLFGQIRTALARHSLTVIRPEGHINKAVSDGAISFFLDHFVRTRVSRYTFGSFGNIKYDPTNLEHLKRRHKVRVFPSGIKVLPDHFTTILPKDTQVRETEEFKEEYFEEFSNKSSLHHMASQVWCYRGHLKNPRWKDQDPNGYALLCTINADLSNVPTEYKKIAGQHVYRVHLDLVLKFGLTEMEAQIAWQRNGKEQRGPAKIVYEP